MQQVADEAPVVLKTLLDTCNIPHLHRAATQGGLCLLTQRSESPAGVMLTCIRPASQCKHGVSGLPVGKPALLPKIWSTATICQHSLIAL
jgi:hypothetical protein